MFINTFKYTPEDVDCKYCTDYSRHGCTNEGCPWLAERIEAGDVSYKEILVTTFAKCMSPGFRSHLCELIDDAPESFWVDDPHRNRFERLHTALGYNKKRDTNRLIALLYLLTADENLFVRCGRCINRGKVDFSTVKLRGIETPDYILYRTAKSIYTCADDFTLNDLEDSAIRDYSFRLIINAMLIVRYGIAVTRIKNNKWWLQCNQVHVLKKPMPYTTEYRAIQGMVNRASDLEFDAFNVAKTLEKMYYPITKMKHPSMSCKPLPDSRTAVRLFLCPKIGGD